MKFTNPFKRLRHIERNTEILLEILDPEGFYTNAERQVTRHLDRVRADHRERYEFAAERLADGNRILDVSCGVGYGSRILASRLPDSRIVGVDIDERAVEFANTHYSAPNITFRQADALQFSDETRFDAIVSFETIEHIENTDALLGRFADLLEPGGKLICSTPNEARMPFDTSRFPFHVRHFTAEEMTAMLDRHGFTVNELHSQSRSRKRSLRSGGDGKFLIFIATRK